MMGDAVVIDVRSAKGLCDGICRECQEESSGGFGSAVLCDPQMPQSGSLRVADLEGGKEAKIRVLPFSSRRFQTLGVELDSVPTV